MRALITAAALALAGAALLAGCGSSGGGTASSPEPLKRSGGSGGAPIGAAVKSCPSDGALKGLRVHGVGCGTGTAVMSSWNVARCRPGKGTSRAACTVRRFRCLSVRTDQGTAVSCTRRGRSISFVLKQ
jgi:hypothetical protein